MDTPLMFARLCAFMEYDFDGSVKQLTELYEIDESDARRVLAQATRERQELDISDEHTDLLDARAREGERHG